MSFRNRVTRLSQLLADRITGAIIETASSGLRVVLSATGLEFYTGDPAEVSPGKIRPSDSSGTGQLELLAPDLGGGVTPNLLLQTQDSFGGFLAQAFLGSAPGTLVSIGNTPGEVSLVGTKIKLTPTGVAAANGVQVGPTGVTPIKGIDFGIVVVNTNASGVATIPHNLGITPTAVLTQITTGSFFAAVTARTSTNFQVTLRDDAGALLPSVARTLMWVAIST